LVKILRIVLDDLEKVHKALTTLIDLDLLNNDTEYYTGWVDALRWVEEELKRGEVEEVEV